ncbi:hypothetical protein DES49_2358 [Halospina denitrificans]|uniref:Uncharacterized protein n=2 Tax=Halospina denitrificans TaxID=332522 RepID=A0A4R7JQH0_9GAMM|nr:hypothetical protein DES49_2358 [Halospina denitrificans]
MRYRERIRSTCIRLPLAIGLMMIGLPALAQSDEEMDDVTMQMVTDEDELSGEMMREIELTAPVGMDSEAGLDEADNLDELEAGVRDETEGLQEDFSEDVITGSDDELAEEVGDVEEGFIDEEGDISVPIDDAIDDSEDLLGDTTDDLEDGVEDSADELEDTTDETTDQLEETLDR